MLWFFLSSNLSLAYKKRINELILMLIRKKVDNLLELTCLYYRNGNAENSVLWF